MSLFAKQKTATGFARVSLAQIISSLNSIWQAAYGTDIDLDPRSADGQIIGGLAEAFDDLNGIAADTVNLLNPNGATGATLSNLLYLTGISRNAASYATAPATFTGTSGTPVPTTFVVKSTADGTLWSPVGAVTIGGGGTVAGTLRCQTIGPLPNGGPPMAGTLTQIITVTAGIDSVTNDVGVRGAIIEGDPNLRIRRQQATAIASQSLGDTLLAALKAIPHITDAVVRENATSSPATIGGSTINPNTLRVVVETDGDVSVDPAHTSASADPVALAIFNAKSVGCATQGAISKAPVDALGVAHTVRYDTATAINVLVAIAVRRRTNWPTDGGAQIQALISAWAKGKNSAGKPNCPIGGNFLGQGDAGQLSWTNVLGSFLGQVPGFDFVSMVFSVDGGATWSTSGANVTIPFGQFAKIASVVVTEL